MFRIRSHVLGMSRIDREPMIMLALAVLDDARRRSGDGPVIRSNAIRLALAYLHRHSNGDRSSYDEFWRECADRKAGCAGATGDITRHAKLIRGFNGILNSLGIPHDGEFSGRLHIVQKRERDEFEAIHGKVPPAV